MIIENPLNQGKMLDGQAAYELGLADAFFAGADFLEQSLVWAAGVLAGRSPWTGPRSTAARPGTPRSRAASRSPGEDLRRPARPRRGCRADRRAPGPRPATRASPPRTTRSRRCRGRRSCASLYAFDLVQKRAKRPAGAPDRSLARPVTKVGIVGAGLMASQLALLFVRRLEVPVVLTDLDQERVDKGVGYVHAEIDKLPPRAGSTRTRPTGSRRCVSGAVDKAEASPTPTS